MKIFAISDPHLSFGTPGKSMDVFGPEWKDHPHEMEARWRELVTEGDIVLIAGDISWAMKLDKALPDLEFLASLPGRKVMIRGNHDYWWASPARIREALPNDCFIIQNDALCIDGVAVGGARLWDDPRIAMGPLAVRTPAAKPDVDIAPPRPDEENERLFVRDLGRLRLSLEALDQNAHLRVAMVHYPPLAPDLADSRAAAVIEEFGVRHCVFGHLHTLLPAKDNPLFGERNGTVYTLTSCDYLEFTPALIAEL